MIDSINGECEAKAESLFYHTRGFMCHLHLCFSFVFSSLQAELPLEIEYLYQEEKGTTEDEMAGWHH